jgi:hypothetical protein
MKQLKLEVISECKQQLLDKIAQLKKMIVDLKMAMENEVKSSVGDKHETARARLQAEEEKLHIQLNESTKNWHDFEKIISNAAHEKVSLGTLVKTNQGVFFVAVALGKMEVDKQTVYVISKEAPIAKIMWGLKAKTNFVFNEKKFEIIEVG